MKVKIFSYNHFIKNIGFKQQIRLSWFSVKWKKGNKNEEDKSEYFLINL